LDELNNPMFVRKLVAGDSEAFSALCHTLNRKLPEFLVRKVGLKYHDAEEVTADVLFKLHGKISDYEARAETKFTTWLFEIAKNAAIDQRRRLARICGEKEKQNDTAVDDCREQTRLQKPNEKREPPLPRLSEFEDEILGTPSRGETKKIIPYKLAFDKLNEAERDILRMRNIMEYAEIGTVEAQDVGALRTRHSRALKRLRDLSEEGGE
jgi:RNA polymerase sigma factor (sigma-70 family)